MSSENNSGLSADLRVKIAIGSQFVEIEMQKDCIASLTATLHQRDAEIEKLKAEIEKLETGSAT